MTDVESAFVDAFQTHRRYLGSVAYRLMGSVTDAEDVLQEAWLRWQSVDRAGVQDPRAFLTTVVTRLCYDQLGSARARREAYYGEWLPEPVVAAEDSPAELAELGESVSLAMLAVMEQLTPAERAAFVLHDVFAVGFDEIGATLERTPEAARQLASRARRRVREGSRRRTEVDVTEHRQAVTAFAAAAANGDIQALLAVLDPDVIWHSDGGGVVRAGVRSIAGADKVSRLVAGLIRRADVEFPGGVFEFALVNDEPGLVFRTASGEVAGVLAFAVAEGRIAEAYVVVNPEKLTRVA
ncbi:RNA polymerase sigma factor SigJ [Kitasatospora sp. NPDC048365]|uniref:RNA polymerase sigma factor SigJ n=1 Tax=Kitasatospora sp. NPDC048365 TaxID=3364050 RepID=UPI0037114D9F